MLPFLAPLAFLAFVILPTTAISLWRRLWGRDA
jgi:hypothetical protein